MGGFEHLSFLQKKHPLMLIFARISVSEVEKCVELDLADQRSGGE